ncbi:hypothetical protein BJ122_10743 [Rhodopseudomonas faecalis]|uniref:Uncharacterized protein n=1 Tax=Rhodopseudomonas faecalis TaxID=99655 RepID=A0A318TUI3_9BRAD|nr:hypothetical protein [Rhodopseudomonas faecalis]PYF03319.1 hypothetical protein BJ122_10743 [Rhodopseudomonas faecalis]
MNWAASIDQLWRTPGLSVWIVLIAAAFLGILVLVALLRERSLANTVLAVIAVAAIVANAIMTLRSDSGAAAIERAPAAASDASSLSHPALACLEEMAGETVLAACEKVVFGSADSVAAAVSHTVSRLNRLNAAGDLNASGKAAELTALRHSLERDRYGLVAYVLTSRDGCQPGECAAFAVLPDHKQIAANMEERLYDTLVQRYAGAWGSGQGGAAATGALTPTAALTSSVPTGKPTNADFPTSNSIPPVSIMTAEPPAPSKPAAAPVAAAPAAAAPAPKPAAQPARNHAAAAAPAAARSQPSAPAQAQAAVRSVPPKNPSAPPKQQPKPAAPVQLAPAAAGAE